MFPKFVLHNTCMITKPISGNLLEFSISKLLHWWDRYNQNI